MDGGGVWHVFPRPTHGRPQGSHHPPQPLPPLRRSLRPNPIHRSSVNAYGATYVLFSEETVGVSGAVNVEADESAVVVEAVDDGGADAVGVID